MKNQTLFKSTPTGMTGRAMLMGSAAGIALSMFMTATTATAQAVVTLDLTPSAYATADIDAQLSQDSPANISAVASGSTMGIEVTTPGDDSVLVTTTLSSVTGALEDNLFTSSATANTSDSSVVLNVSPTFADDTVAVGTSQRNNGTVDADLLGNTHSVMISGDTSTTVDGESIFVGTLIVDNNDMSASATSNNAVASIDVAGGVSLDGTGNGAAALTDLNGTNDFSGSADLVVATSQYTGNNITATIGSAGNDSGVYVNVETVDGATATLTGSDITASASANVLTGALDATDSTTNAVGASVAMAGLQVLNDDVTATIYDTQVELTAGFDNNGNTSGYTDNSTLTVDRNTIIASATGNNSTQAVGLTANSLVGDIASATSADATIGTTVELRAAADAVVTNYQVQSGNYEVLATVSGSNILLDAYDSSSLINDSTLNLTANRIGTQAAGAVATTGLTLTANAIDATGAVASVQSSDSDVTARTIGSRISANMGRDLFESTATVTGNRITALASGVQAASALTIADGTNNLTIDANTGSVVINAAPGVTDSAQPNVEAAYVVTNDQASTGDTAATIIDGQISLYLNDDSSGSVQTLDSNVLSATAYGQTASNAIDLSFNNLLGTAASATAATPVLAATANAQSMTGASVTAEVYGYSSGSANAPIFNYVSDELSGGSSVSTSSNVVSATVVGNRTLDNSLTVAPNNLIMAGSSQTAPIDISNASIDAAAQLMVTSLQEADGVTLTASQNDIGGSSNWILTDLGSGDVIRDSSVVSDNNLMTVSTTANSAINDIALGGAVTTEVAVSSALISSQSIESTTMVSELGVVGGTTDYASSNTSSTATNLTLNALGSGQYINNGVSAVTLTFGAALTALEQSILTAAGFTNITSTTAEIAAGATVSVNGRLAITYENGTDTTDNTGDETFQVTAFNATDVPVEGDAAGVFITTGDDLLNSTVSVSDNTLASAIMGNEAVNTLVADATTMGTVISGPAGGTMGVGAATVGADSVLINRQDVDPNTTSDSSVYGTFAFDQGLNDGMSGSTVTIDSNMIEASATNNSAANAVVLTATNANTTAALANLQSSDGDVQTISDMEVFTNVETLDSTVSMSDNVNQSLASVNTASNRVSLAATNIGSVNGGDASGTLTTGGITTGADLSLNSSQYAGGTNGSSALANTTIYNEDQVDTTVGSIDSSTYAMNGNATVSQSTVNSVNNVLMVGSADTANNDATAGLNNLQNSATTSDATSTSSITLDMTSATLDNIIDSTVSLDGNTTTARATGNSATNALNATGANMTAGTGADANVDLVANTVDASYYVGSAQLSTANVTATSTAITSVDLASDTTGLEGSTLSLDDNAVAAYATANMVSNSVLNMGGEDTATLDATGAVSNYQNSSGIVSASASNNVGATFDAFAVTDPADAALNGSTASIQNNSTVAMARGNVASNSLSASAVNATVGSGPATIDSTAGTTSASYALVNTQLNQATINATSVGASYGAILNGAALTSGEPALANSMLSVSGNLVQAVGYGNIATNSVTLASLNSSSNDATAALFSTQINTGPVTATARNASIGYSGLGALTNATLSVGGNTVSASAVGNLATSRITRN